MTPSAPRIPFRAHGSPALLEIARRRYALEWTGEPVDLGGINLNIHLPDDAGLGHVVRVYAPWVTAPRLLLIQAVREKLRAAGLPFTEAATATDGASFVEHDGRVAEVDRYVHGVRMDETRQLETGMAMLGRVHNELARLDLTDEGCEPQHPNHIEADVALAWAQRAAAVVRGWPDATERELDVAEGMTSLASALAPVESALRDAQVRQLVHGDFWDNNVLFDDRGEIAAVLDLDFMGERPRIDDVALTFYYTTSELRREHVADEHLARLRGALDVYDGALEEKLSADERASLPFAVARTVLFMARNIVRFDAQDEQRRAVEGIATDVVWSLTIARDPDRCRAAFI